MAIRITCPGCKTTLTLDDDKRGQKVRCDNCDKALNIPAASGAKREKELAVQNGQKVKVKAKSTADPFGGDEDDAPKKKKKKKQSGGELLTWLMVGCGALVFLGAVGGGVTWLLKNRKEFEPEPERPVLLAKKEEKEEMRSGARIVVPNRNEGNPANMKKGGTAIINNIRGSAWRTERRAELRAIGVEYLTFCDSYKGAGRNLMNFKEHIKFGQSTVREAIEEGYYVMNFKADPREPSSIVAYERDEDNQGFKGHNVVKGDGSVQYISTAELKAALGN
jgi:predicted Zn finger-like uncharacterized protein